MRQFASISRYIHESHVRRFIHLYTLGPSSVKKGLVVLFLASFAPAGQTRPPTNTQFTFRFLRGY